MNINDRKEFLRWLLERHLLVWAKLWIVCSGSFSCVVQNLIKIILPHYSLLTICTTLWISLSTTYLLHNVLPPENNWYLSGPRETYANVTSESFYFHRGIGLWDFSLKPAEFVRKLAKGGVNRFTASIDAGGVPIHVEIITGIRFGRPAFAVGFAFDRESFGKVAEKLSGIGVDFLDKLGFELEVIPTILSNYESVMHYKLVKEMIIELCDWNIFVLYFAF